MNPSSEEIRKVVEYLVSELDAELEKIHARVVRLVDEPESEVDPLEAFQSISTDAKPILWAKHWLRITAFGPASATDDPSGADPV